MQVNSTIRHGELSEMNMDIFIREKGISLRQTENKQMLPQYDRFSSLERIHFCSMPIPNAMHRQQRQGDKIWRKSAPGHRAARLSPPPVCAHDALRRYKARKTAARRWCSSAPLGLRRRTRCGGGYALRPPQSSRQPPSTETHRYREICCTDV